MGSVGHAGGRATRAASRGAAHALSRGLRLRAKPASLSPSPRPAARLARAWRAACVALAVCLALPLFHAPAAEAQTSTTLVSNTGQTNNRQTSLANDAAQSFTTGSVRSGYRLKSVGLPLEFSSGTHPTYTVAIHSDSSGSPGTSLGTLHGPPIPSSGTRNFSTGLTDSIALAANTKYWVVIDVSATGTDSAALRATSSDAEDSGAAAGWSIENSSRARNATRAGAAWATSAAALRITVKGYPAVGAGADGRTLDITFNKDLKTTQVPAANRFRYTRGDGTVLHNPRSVSIPEDRTVRLTLRHTIAPGETVTVRYIAPDSGGLQDSSGTAIASFTYDTVTNITADVTPPRVVDAFTNANGDAYILEFDESGIGCSTAITEAQLKVNTTVRSQALPRCDLSDRITFTRVDPPIGHGDTVTVSYAGTSWDDQADNQVAQFTDLPVRNLVPPAATIQSVAITSVPSTDSDSDNTPDTYNNREHIEVTVTYDRDVTWDLANSNSELRVRLRVGTAARTAVLVTGDPTRGTTRSLVFRYRVVAADTDTDGIAVEPVSEGGVNQLVLLRNGATLKPAVGNGVSRTHAGLSADAGHKVKGSTADNTAPSRSGVTVEGATLTLTYNERLRESSVPDPARFTVRVGSSTRTVDAVDVSGKTVVLTLASAVLSTDTVTLNYTRSGTRIEDLAGNDALNFINQPVTVTDTTGPQFVSATVNGSSLVITFDETLSTAAADKPSGARFSWWVDGDLRRDPSIDVAVSGSTVTLTLPGGSAPYGAVIEVQYTPFHHQAHLEDTNDNDAPGFIRKPVTNETPEPNAHVTSATVNGSTFVITFDKALSTAAENRPDGGRFPWTLNGDLRTGTVFTVAVSGKTVTLTLSGSVPAGAVVTLTYIPQGHLAHLKYTDDTSVPAVVQVPVTNQLTDTVPPTLSTTTPPTVSPSGTTLTLTFDEGLAATGADPWFDGWYSLRYGLFVTKRGRENQHPSAVHVNGTTVTLTLGSREPIRPDEKLYVNYDPSAVKESWRLKDAAGNEVAAFHDVEVTNDTDGGTGGPALVLDHDWGIAQLFARGTAAGAPASTIRIVLSEALDPDSAPAGSAFQVRAAAPGKDERRIAGTGTVSIVGSQVEVTLAEGVEDTALASVRYTKPDRDPLQDTEGNDANDFKTNRVTVIDEQPPVRKAATVAGSKLTITYHEALDPDSVPATTDFRTQVAGAGPAVAASASEPPGKRQRAAPEGCGGARDRSGYRRPRKRPEI